MKPTPHYYVKSLAMALPAVLIGLQISAWIGFVLSPARQERADFRAYYYAGEMVRTGRGHDLYQRYDPTNPTSAFIHPAYEALLFMPLTFLRMRAAHLLWVILNCVVIYFAYRALRPELNHLRELFAWLPVGIFASYLPINEALMQGQDSFLLLLLVAMAFMRLCGGRFFEAGVWLGLGVFRFQFLAVVLVLFLLWRGWKLAAGFCASGFAMFLLSVAVAGFAAQKEYVNLLRRLADPSQQPVSGMVNLRALMTASGAGSRAVLIGVSALMLLLVMWFGRGSSWNQRMLLAVAAACLLGYHTFLHDLSLLIVPIAVTCDAAVESREYIRLGVLAFVLALPTLLAMEGLPLWMNSVGAIIVVIVLAFATKKSDSLASQGALVEAAG